MAEIAQISHLPGCFVDIMAILDKRLNDSGKNWRHVYKVYKSYSGTVTSHLGFNN
jgi:epsin